MGAMGVLRWPSLPESAQQWILHAVICYPVSRIFFQAVQTAGRLAPMGRPSRTD